MNFSKQGNYPFKLKRNCSKMGSNRTYAMIKPDAIQRGLVGRIIQRFEDKGMQLLGLKMKMADDDILEEHYADLKERPFYETLIDYIKSGPVVCMIWSGNEAVSSARSIIGATNPSPASNGTIRADFGQIAGRNLIHGADSDESAEKEIGLWFNEDEIVEYESSLKQWILDC